MHRISPAIGAALLLTLALTAGGIVAAQTQGGSTTGPNVPVGGTGDTDTGSADDGATGGGAENPALDYGAPDDGPDWYERIRTDDDGAAMANLSLVGTDAVDVGQMPRVSDFDRTIRTHAVVGDEAPPLPDLPDDADWDYNDIHVVVQFDRDDPAAASGGGGLLTGITSAIGLGGPGDVEDALDLTPCGSYMAPGGWENAHCYAVPTDRLDDLVDHDAVRAVLHRDADWKTTPETRTQIREGDGERLVVETYPDSELDADALDEALGVNVTAQAASPHTFVSDPVSSTATLDGILEHEHVAWVEWLRPVNGTLDGSREHVGANDLNGRVGNGGLGVTGKGSLIGVLDSGIQRSHPHFDDVTITESADWVDWGMPPEDETGHGTHVAGTITGNSTAPDGTVLTGVAPDADLVVARGLNANDVWATTAGRVLARGRFARMANDAPGTMDAISNSWGVDDTSRITPISRYGKFARSADKWALQNPSTLVIFANGNACEQDTSKKVDEIGCARHVQAPALGKNVLSVGATFEGGKVSTLNDLNPPEDVVDLNTGRVKPEVLAPGEGVRAPVPTDGYDGKRGTSMATPHVSGVVALLKQKYGGLDANELRALLVATTSPVRNPDDLLEGHGEVNAHDALRDNNYEATQRRFGGSVKEGRRDTYRFSVPKDAHQIDASLAWLDPNEVAGGTKGIVFNRLDLKLTSPSGTTHRRSTASNVKKLTVEDPDEGQWKLQVIGANTGRWYNKPQQDYDGVVRVIADEPAVGVAVNGSTMPGFERAGAMAQNAIHVDPGNETDVTVAPLGLGSVVSDVDVEVSTAGIRGLRHCDASQRASLDAGDLSRGQQENLSVCFEARNWANAGVRDVQVQITSTNGVNSSANPSNVTFPVLIAENTAPDRVRNVRSTSHTAGAWSNDPVFRFAWDRGSDDAGGTGLEGYHHELIADPSRAAATGRSLGPGEEPPFYVDDPDSTALTVNRSPTRHCYDPHGAPQRCATPPSRIDVNGSHWFHVRAQDASKNLGPHTRIGPFKLDLSRPAPFALRLGNVSGGNVDVRQPDGGYYDYTISETDVDVVWRAPSDTHSGLQNYSYMAAGSTSTSDSGTVAASAARISPSIGNVNPGASGGGSGGPGVDSSLSLTLQRGSNGIQVTAYDAAGNARQAGLRVCVEGGVDGGCTTPRQAEQARDDIRDAEAVRQMGLDEPGRILEEGMLEKRITERMSCPGTYLCGDSRPRYADMVANEDVLLRVTGPDGEVTARYFAEMDDGEVTSVQRVSDPATVDETVEVTTDASTLQGIVESDDTMGAIGEAYDGGAIEIRGVGLGNRLKYGAFETGYGAYKAASGAYDAVSGAVP